MRVSIITVTKNSQNTIADTINSVFAQTYFDIEYIVVDGKSSDNTVSIVESYSTQNIKLISEPDNGIYEAINKGIKIASGYIIGLLHADDFFADNGVIERVVSNFKKTPDVDIVFADILFVDHIDATRVIRHYSSEYFYPILFRFGFMPAHPATYIKRSCFEKSGYYREDMRIAADFELLLRYMYVNKLSYLYTKDTWVKMRTGGISTAGLKATKKINREILFACKENHIYSNLLFVYSKYLIKWWGFLFKKSI